MSVELRGTAIDILPVKPQKVQDNGQSIKELTDLELSVESKLIRVNESAETQNIHNISEKDAVEEKKVMTAPQLENVAKQLQEFIGKMNRGLEFSVDKDSGRDVIKVIDKNSGDVIKQYPSEEVLSLVSKLSETIGNFVDSKV